MTRKQKRLTGIAGIGLVLALAVLLVSVALRDEIVFFYDPSEVITGDVVNPGDRFRLGGVVEDGSVDKQNRHVRFVVTDGAESIKVSYDGILPDLFREGQGVIAEGKLQADGSFVADNVLAKHDENYVPKELEHVMKDKNETKGEGS